MEYSGKITAGKEKLQREAQICKLLSECNTGITHKEHTLDSVRSYTNSPQLLPWLRRSFSVPVENKMNSLPKSLIRLAAF